MAGKRIRKSNKRCLRVCSCLLAVTAAVGLMMPLTGSADADSASADSPARPVVTAADWGQRAPSVVAHDAELPDIHRLGALVKESAPVDDTYFDDVVFLGDSRTEGFKLYSGLSGGDYLYATGATVDTAVTRPSWPLAGRKVPLVEALDPKENVGKVYVMLGVNELGWKGTDLFRDRCVALVERIRSTHPQAEIILQSILPVSAEQEARHTYVNNGRILEYNRVIRQVAETENCWFIDVAEAVTDDTGCLPEDISFDGVHLNRAGCRLWLDYLRTHAIVKEP